MLSRLTAPTRLVINYEDVHGELRYVAPFGPALGRLTGLVCPQLKYVDALQCECQC